MIWAQVIGLTERRKGKIYQYGNYQRNLRPLEMRGKGRLQWKNQWDLLTYWIKLAKKKNEIKYLILELEKMFSSVQFNCSVVSSSLWPMGCIMPGFTVHHQLPEATEIHVHHISDAIQPSHSLSSSSLPPSIFPSIRVFKWVSSSHQVAKVLEFQLQHQSFQWIFRADFL